MTLPKPAPRTTLRQRANRLWLDSISTRDIHETIASGKFTADRADLLNGQAGIRISGTVAQLTAYPALRSSISHVVALCAEEQMRWPYTRRVVTVMEDQQSRGDRTDYQFPRSTMRVHESAIDPRAAIAGDCSDADPGPALAGLIDLRPEAGGNIVLHRSLTLGATTPDVLASRGHTIVTVVAA